jgi:hypothetical protein
MMLRALLAACVLLMSPVADAAQLYGPASNCSGAIGVTPANITFPTSGTGATAPADYLLIQNNSINGQVIWINDLGSVATTAPPSIQLVPTASVTYSSAYYPMPPSISIVASAAGAVYTCHYK